MNYNNSLIFVKGEGLGVTPPHKRGPLYPVKGNNAGKPAPTPLTIPTPARINCNTSFRNLRNSLMLRQSSILDKKLIFGVNI